MLNFLLVQGKKILGKRNVDEQSDRQSEEVKIQKISNEEFQMSINDTSVEIQSNEESQADIDLPYNNINEISNEESRISPDIVLYDDIIEISNNEYKIDMDELPDEIILEFCQYFSLSELKNMSRVNKHFNRVIDDEMFLTNIAKRNNLPLEWLNKRQKLNFEKYRFLSKWRTEDCSLYSREFVDLVGGEKALALLPKFDVRLQEYIDFGGGQYFHLSTSDHILPKSLKGNKIMRGVGVLQNRNDDGMWEWKKIGFLVLCVKKNTMQNHEGDLLSELDVYIFYKNNDIDNNPLKLVNGPYTYAFNLNNGQDYFDYLRRLIDNQPSFDLNDIRTENPIHTLSDGRSVVELTDQSDKLARQFHI